MEQDAQQLIDLYFKTYTTTTNTAGNIVRVINELLKCLDRDSAAQALNKYIDKGGEISCSFCQPQYANALSKKLNAFGINHIATYNTAREGTGMIIYAAADENKVKKILEQYIREPKMESGLVTTEQIFIRSNDNVRKMEGLSYYEASLFAIHAKEQGVSISAEQTGLHNEYTVFYNAKEIQDIQNIQKMVSLELAGTAGKALEKQIDYEETNFNTIRNKIMNHQNEKEFYIADINGESISVNKDEIIYTFQDGHRVFDLNENPEWLDDIANLVAEMRNPVYMDKNTFMKWDRQDNEKKIEILYEQDKKNGRPELTQAEYEAAKRINEKIQLYYDKLAMGPVEQLKFHYALTNDEMKLAEFKSMESVNQEAKEDIVEEKIETEEELITETKERIDKYKEQDKIENRTLNEYQTAYDLEHGNPLRENDDPNWEVELDLFENDVESNNHKENSMPELDERASR